MMEVVVHIGQTSIKDASRFILRCKIQAAGSGNSRETHEGSVAISQPSVTSDRPHVSFTFASRPAQLSLLFVVMNSRQDSGNRFEKELGRCEGQLSTSTSQTRHSQTLLFSRQIEGTNVGMFAGKLTYTAHISTAVGPNLKSLLADEAKQQTCLHVLPSESPFVSVVFNYARARVSPGSRLVGIARTGDRSDITEDVLLQASDGSSHHQLHNVSLLKPVRLTCEEFDCLELHVAERLSARVLFSSSRALNRLAPFKPVHYSYDGPPRPGGGSSGGSGEASGVSISVLYTPSRSQFSRYEGLEVAVCDVSLPRAVAQCRDVVMGTRVIQSGSKTHYPTLDSNQLQPPFLSLPTKGANPMADSDYHISVLRYHSRQLITAPVKSYLLTPCSSEGVNLLFRVYGSSGNDDDLWWNTDICASATLQIDRETLTVLQTGEHPTPPWSTSGEDSFSVSGVMRWKSRQTRFFTESSVISEALATGTRPAVNMLEREVDSTFPTNQLSGETHGPLDPDRETEYGEGDTSGGTDILSQLTEFESKLHRMASDHQTLHREYQHLQRNNKQLQLQIEKLSSSIRAPTTVQTRVNLQQLSMSDLIERVQSLQQSLQAEERAYERIRKRNQDLQNDLSTLQELEARHAELLDTHSAEKRLVQRLRDKVAKYHKCSEICKKQESVITQLESLLAKQAEGATSTKDSSAVSLLSRENAHLRDLLQQCQKGGDYTQMQAVLLEKEQTIHSLKSQLSTLVSRCQSLEHERARGGGGGGGGRSRERAEFSTRVFKLEQKLLVADAKLKAQTGQLQDNAEKWTLEKAQYELQLADFRSRLDTVIRSGQQALSTVHMVPTTPSPNAGQSDSVSQCSQGRDVQQNLSGKTNKKEFSF